MNVSLGNVGNVGNVINIGNTVNIGNKNNTGNKGNSSSSSNSKNTVNVGNVINIGNTVNSENKINEENKEKLETAGTTMKSNTKKRMAYEVAQNEVERKTDDFRYMLRSTSVNEPYSSDYYSSFDVSV